jgi:type II secretory pathway pseudopilin PulG
VVGLIFTGATIGNSSDMKNRESRNSGWTLLEIMIVVSFISMLAAIAIPHFVKARGTSQANTCINNLRQLDAAMQQYALENRLDVSTSYTLDVLRPYMATMPACPASGIYSPGPTLTNSPTCSLSTATPAHIFQ